MMKSSGTPPAIDRHDQIPESLRLTVALLKGGGTRSTTAVFLALALARRTSEVVLLVDIDSRNARAYSWAFAAQKNGEQWPANLDVMFWPVATLREQIEAYNAAHVIIDTGNDAEGLEAALAVTDQVIMPVQTSTMDNPSVRPTLDVIRRAEEKKNREIFTQLVLTRTKANTRSLRQSREAYEGMGINVLTADVRERELYKQAFPTVPKDLGTYEEVLREIVGGRTA